VTLHALPLERRTLHGHFSRDLHPVLAVAPGDTVRLAVPNAGWWLASRERFEPRDEERDAGHALAGPIEVRGARAGGTLAVRVDDVRPASWGITPVDAEHALHWELDTEAGVGRTRDFEVGLRPFLGILGMPPPEPGAHSTVPPRRFGGNIDCRELGPGATLFLPIPVDGALFSAGDGHARQGDGEVCGCAIECPVEAELTLDLHDDLSLEWPVARTRAAWIAFGFDEDLDAAAAIATEGLVALLGREHGVPAPDALGLASVAADLRITQVVNGVKGVHAVLEHDAIRLTS
jgi:acetamidase/formamidase